MQLTFLGTRGEIEKRTRRHRMHTSLMVLYRGGAVMIDCSLDWLGKFERLHPSAIVITHAHPDRACGLREGARCPVHAPQQTWRELRYYPVKDRRLIKERTPTKICGITFEAFPVEHSILTHCGSEIVTDDEHKLSAKLRAMATERGTRVRIAYDGTKLEL